MSVATVQTFTSEDRVYDGLSQGVLVVDESILMAEVDDPIRVLYGDDVDESDDYVVRLILRLRLEPTGNPRVAIYFSDKTCARRWPETRTIES